MTQHVALASLVIFLGVGCGPTYEFAPVKGKLLKIGEPMADVKVTFMPDGDAGGRGPSSMGITDANGSFTLHYYDPVTKKEGEGAVVGPHKVTLEDLRFGGIPQGEALPARRFTDNYSMAWTTPLGTFVKKDSPTVLLVVSE